MESYVYNLRNTLRKLEAAVNETTNWLDVSQKASKEEYEDRKAELETLAQYVCFHFFFVDFLLLQSLFIHRRSISASGAPDSFSGGPGGQSCGFP